MSIYRGQCPLDAYPGVPPLEAGLAKHVHDDCVCLDHHVWDKAVYGTSRCTRKNTKGVVCGVQRCTTFAGNKRCTRRLGHAGRHVMR